MSTQSNQIVDDSMQNADCFVSRNPVERTLEKILGQSWYGLMESAEAEELLQGQKNGTYLFRIDEIGDIFLSGVNNVNTVQHAKIENRRSIWWAFNGNDYKSNVLHELIPLSLHCEKGECSPLIKGR